MTGRFTLVPELAKKNNVTDTYDLHLYGSVKEGAFSDYKDSGELYGFEAKDDSGLPSGLLKALRKEFSFLRVLLINEEKANELKVRKEEAKVKVDLERKRLQAKQSLISSCDVGSVKTLFHYLQQECFLQVKKVVKEGDIYTINKGDREIGQVTIKKIEENSLEIPKESLTQIIEEVNQSSFNHLRKSIHTFAKEEIGCLVHADFIPTGSTVKIPVTFLIAHCPGKGQQISDAISKDGKLIIEYDLLTTNNSEDQRKYLREFAGNKCILVRTS